MLLRASLLVIAAVLACVAGGCAKDQKLGAQQHLARAEQYLKENKNQDAMIELRNAIQLNPQLAQAHYELGSLILSKQLLPSALQEFRLAIKYDPESESSHLAIADIYLRAGHFQTGHEKKLELVLRKSPNRLERGN